MDKAETKTFAVSMTVGDHQAIKVLADERGMSVSALLRDAALGRLDQDPATERMLDFIQTAVEMDDTTIIRRAVELLLAGMSLHRLWAVQVLTGGDGPEAKRTVFGVRESVMAVLADPTKDIRAEVLAEHLAKEAAKKTA